MTPRDRPYFMATPTDVPEGRWVKDGDYSGWTDAEMAYFMVRPRSTEAPDSALQDILAVGFSIAVLLIIFALASLVGR